jgi:hypothetical protein
MRSEVMSCGITLGCKKGSLMPQRKLRIVRRVKNVPVLGMCESCNMQFAVRQPPGEQAQAQAAIQQQFNAHKCERQDLSQAPVRILKEAKEKD